MQIIDTHSHIDTHHFIHDFEQVLTRSRAAGVVAQILPGVCQAWWKNLLNISETHHDLHPALGLHPLYMAMHKTSHLEELRQHAASGKLVAIGEIGLDYLPDDIDREAQQRLFKQQLAIAKEYDLPLLLHVRKAHDQVQSVIRKTQYLRGGIVHAFNGSLQQAEKYIQLGFTLSFGGNLTYDRARRIRTLAQALPLETIVLETDAPDIPPANHNGERNSPEYLPQILAALAELRKETREHLATQTTKNVLRVLGIKLL